MSGSDIIIADLRVQLYEARQDAIEQAKTHAQEVADLRRQLARLRARMPSYGDVEAIRRCVHGVASGDDMVWAVAWLARQEDSDG